jgi:hypothetical protein
MIMLNNLVFGNTVYQITDHRLFSTDTLHNKVYMLTISESPAQLQGMICVTTTTEGYFCGTPSYEGCNGPYGCDRCGNQCYSTGYSSTSECLFYDDNGNPQPLPPGTGGGGGGIPYSYPCTNGNNLMNIAPGEPLPTCPPPNNGSGWNPNPPLNLNTPCGVIDSLLKTSHFTNNLQNLRDSCTKNYEKAITIRNPFIPLLYDSTIFTGLPSDTDTMEVNIDMPIPIDGYMHNHPKGSKIFGADDIFQMAKTFLSSRINNTQIFTFSVVSDSTSYVIMISDLVKFQAFVNTWFSTLEKAELFSNFYYDTYEMDKNISIQQKEINFFKALNTFPNSGSGIKLFRGNQNMTIFSPIKLNSNGQIRPDPCQ